MRASSAPVCCASSKNWLRWSKAKPSTSSHCLRAGDHAMQARERRVAIRAAHAVRIGFASAQEVVEFGGRRHRGRAAVTRHDQRAACVRRARAGFERLVAQPAGEKARRERIARAEHVQHFDFDAAVNRRIVERSGHLAVDDRAAQRPALDHQRRAASPRAPSRAHRSVRSLPPAMRNSSSVPITRSNSGRMPCRCAVTPSFATKRVSPSALPVRPHSTGR